jgi:hypothetical protein
MKGKPMKPQTQFLLEREHPLRLRDFWPLILLAALLCAGITCFGQEPAGTNNVAPVNAPVVVGEGITGTIISLANQYPLIASLLIALGSLRLFIKPLMAGLRLWTSSTDTRRDDEILDKVERSWAYTGFLFLLDWLTSIKLTPKTSATNSRTGVNAVLICAVSLGILGCVGKLDPAGVYKGDQVLHKSELATTTAYSVIHTYVSWEKDNRAALAPWPEIKQSADKMRADSKQWFSTAYALHDAYEVDPTPESAAALNKALNVLRAALNEAAKYMAQAAAASPQ